MQTVLLVDNTSFHLSRPSTYFELQDPHGQEYRRFFHQDATFYQMVKMSNFGSFLANDTVIGEGDILGLHKADPLLLVIGHLFRARQRNKCKQSVDQILSSDW